MRLPAFILVNSICLASASTLLWSDEFDNSMSYELDAQYWDYDLGAGVNQWGNGELQTYTKETANARVENGNLVIQAHKTTAEDGSAVFTSARVKTMGKVAFKYGTLEAKIQMPDTVSGLWPAFWLLGDVGKAWPDSGEIDIAEVGWRGQDNKKVYSAAHWVHEGTYAVHDGSIDFPTDLNGAWHIYKLEWNSTFIETFVDEMSVMRLDIGPNCTDCEEFHWQHGIHLNLAVGGGFTTDQQSCGGSSSSSGSSGGCDFRGPEDITAPFPASMSVDWIRLYDNGETELSTAEIDEQATLAPTSAISVETPVSTPTPSTPVPSTPEPSSAVTEERTTFVPTAVINEVIPTAPVPVSGVIPTPTAPVRATVPPVPSPVREVIPTAQRPSGGGTTSGKGNSGKGNSKSGKGGSKSGKGGSKSGKKSKSRPRNRAEIWNPTRVRLPATRTQRVLEVMQALQRHPTQHFLSWLLPLCSKHFCRPTAYTHELI